MSTDGTSPDREVRRGIFSGQSANSPRTILLIVICSVVALIVLRWTVFRPLADAAKMAVDNKQYQEELKKRLDIAEKDADDTATHVNAITSELQNKDVDLKEILARVAKMQAAFLETANDIEQVKWQAKDVEAAKARSLAGARRIKARAEPVQMKLRVLRQLVQGCSNQVTPLFQNEAGRRIAASGEHLERFRFIPKSPPATFTQVTNWEQSLQEL